MMRERKEHMDPKISKFISSHRVGVLATLLKDATPHVATLHYAHTTDPLAFYFSTEKTSRKCQNLLDGKSTPASYVIGFSEEEWITLQMDGNVRAILNPEELQKVQRIFYAKHPSSEKYKDDPATLFLCFTPTWWRYTDYNTTPMTILSSET